MASEAHITHHLCVRTTDRLRFPSVVGMEKVCRREIFHFPNEQLATERTAMGEISRRWEQVFRKNVMSYQLYIKHLTFPRLTYIILYLLNLLVFVTLMPRPNPTQIQTSQPNLPNLPKILLYWSFCFLDCTTNNSLIYPPAPQLA